VREETVVGEGGGQLLGSRWASEYAWSVWGGTDRMRESKGAVFTGCGGGEGVRGGSGAGDGLATRCGE
jgi:hypothetical protein